MMVVPVFMKVKMNEKKWSVTISGKNDCVVMTDEEAMVITLKFSPILKLLI